ncbi:MAG: lipoate--protein ligase [Bacteroidales bacterium]|nr:lipoate--protein ligase [Bacteroidales bacterium]
MKYLQNSSTDPHYNMAFDEFCLEHLKADEPVFYLWQNRPSVIIGLNQSAYAEVNLPYLQEKGIVLARRVTGGGAVYHDLQNLNYTITGRIRDLETDYPAYVETMARALRSLGVPAELSGRNDILVDGRKCSGYAKRMSKDRLMIHGTLMYDVDIDTLTKALAVPGSKLSAAGISSVRSRVANLKEYLPQFPTIQAFQDALQALLAGDDEEIRLTEDQLAQIEADAAGKFRTWEWNYGHSPAASFQIRQKFPCGTVEAAFSLRNGCIDRLRFSGDFLGNLPPDTIESALQDCRYTREDILSVLQAVKVDECFDALTREELTDFLLGG